MPCPLSTHPCEAATATKAVRASSVPIHIAEDVPPQELIEVETTDHPLEGDVAPELLEPGGSIVWSVLTLQSSIQ